MNSLFSFSRQSSDSGRQLVGVGFYGLGYFGIRTWWWDRSGRGNVLDIREFLGLVGANRFYVFPRRYRTRLRVVTWIFQIGIN